MESTISKEHQPKVRFFSPEVLERPWGEEIIVGIIPGIAVGKILHIRAGEKGGLQKHHEKVESAYVVSGRLIFRRVIDGQLVEEVLGPGDAVHIPPGAVHQEEALEDTVIFETGSPHLNDRVRVEKEFGLEEEGGLPTTRPEEIQIAGFPENWRG